MNKPPEPSEAEKPTALERLRAAVLFEVALSLNPSEQDGSARADLRHLTPSQDPLAVHLRERIVGHA